MKSLPKSQLLLNKLRSAIPEDWRLDDLTDVASSVSVKWIEGDEDVIAEAVHLSVAEFPAAGPEDVERVRCLCGIAMALSLVSLSSPHAAGMFKAVALALHLGIDILADYDLSARFCKLVAPVAAHKGAVAVEVIVTGDMGIALARTGKLRDALRPLEEALALGLQQEDYNAASRYASEAGQCEFHLGEFSRAAMSWSKALVYAKRCNDPALEQQISSNIRTLEDLSAS